MNQSEKQDIVGNTNTSNNENNKILFNQYNDKTKSNIIINLDNDIIDNIENNEGICNIKIL